MHYHKCPLGPSVCLGGSNYSLHGTSGTCYTNKCNASLSTMFKVAERATAVYFAMGEFVESI